MGIGSSFKLPGVRYALVAFGSVLLIFSIVLILQQPGVSKLSRPGKNGQFTRPIAAAPVGVVFGTKGQLLTLC